ncbi:MAG: lipid A biosynthesis lauroyl acyltransferase [Rhodospirillales bacterium]
MLKRLIQRLEAAALNGIFALIRLLPFRAASALGGFLGRTVGPLLRAHRTALKNLKRAFPEKSDADIAAIAKAMWDNIGRTAFEYPHLGKFVFYESGRENPNGNVEIVGLEHAVKLRDDGKAGIFFSGHLANWEVMAHAIHYTGIPPYIFYRAPNNPYVENIFRSRKLWQGDLIPKGAEGARRAIACVRDGGHLGMLVDQKMNDGIAVPFFGRDAMTAPALAQFALKGDLPVAPMNIERLGGVRMRVTFYPAIPIRKTANRHADILAAMTNVNKIIETWIRRHPEQWLWVHNRWPD